MKDNSEQNFEAILSQQIIEPKLFKQLCSTGIPMRYRLVSYMILLDVVGLDTSKFKQALEARSIKYRGYLLRNDGRNIPGDSGKALGTASLKSARIDPSLEHQINIDVMRIGMGFRWFNGSDYSEVFYNVLSITAYKRPYIGYVQGMADIVAPMLYLHFVDGEEYAEEGGADIQSAVYHCFSSLMNRIQTDIFQLQDHLLNELERVLLATDKELSEHLRMLGLELHMVCFRWFSCLFIREFSIEAWFRIFDSMLCSEISKFSVFFAAALLIWHREYILGSDFCGIITRMQNLNESELSLENVESLIGTANFLHRDHGDGGAHR